MRRDVSATRVRQGPLVWSLAVALASVALVVPAAAATGGPGAGESLVVEGSLVQVVVEPVGGTGSGELEIVSAVDVDGTSVTLPPDLGDVTGRTGDAVTIVIEAPAGLGVSAALEVVAEPEVRDEARVVEVLPGPTLAAVTDAPVADGTIGVHSLLVLPVYWAAPDAATTSSLGAVAATTAQYWSEQTGGGLVLAPTVRDWAVIADPLTCDTATIWSRALAAHGVAAPGPDQHVLVYFPRRTDCAGWAGRATLGGGQIWINGSLNLDVMAHEFGHNLGLGHANTATCFRGARVSLALPLTSGCTVSEYADRADVMGIGLSAATGNLTSAFADFLGLAVVSRPAAGAVTRVELAPLTAVGALRSVAIPVAGGTVYVDFRPAVGRDVRMPAWAGVQVHLRTVDPDFGFPTTYLLDMASTTPTPFASPALAAGASWAVPGTTHVVTVTSVGSTAWVSVGPAGSAAPDPAVLAYVTRVYLDLFGRGVDPEGLSTWAGLLASGTPRIAVANAITSSGEFRGSLVIASYMTYLGRQPDPAGHAFWLSRMAAGMTIQQMEAGFLASDEYFAQAGATGPAWVQRLYGHVLGRSAGPGEVAFWLDALGRGSSRADVAIGFVLSTEHLTSVVDARYQQLLGRGIDPAGRQYWVTAIQGGTRLETIIGGIVASPEYYARS